MRAGASETVITPLQGAWLLGSLQRNTGTHDDLFARALVLDDGQRSVAIVCLDLPGLDIDFNDDLVDAIVERTQVDQVLINCSHTHSAPFTIPWSSGFERHRNEEHEWRENLLNTIPTLVASITLQPVTLEAAHAPVQIGTNRRRRKGAEVHMEPNPDDVTDQRVDVLILRDLSNEILAILYSHAAHPVIVHASSSTISADYPGAAATRIRALLGDQVVPLFAQGCCGNINADPWRGGHAKADAAGYRLGSAVVQAIDQALAIPDPSIDFVSHTITLPCQALPSRDQIAMKILDVEARRNSADPADAMELWRCDDILSALQDVTAMIAGGRSPAARHEINALFLGSQWTIITMPHEPFFEYTEAIRATVPSRHGMVWGYTNGCETYVPTDAALREGLGYEASGFPSLGSAALKYPLRAPLAPGAEEAIRNTLDKIFSDNRAANS